MGHGGDITPEQWSVANGARSGYSNAWALGGDCADREPSRWLEMLGSSRRSDDIESQRTRNLEGVARARRARMDPG